jgi:Zn-dependent M28 family amino/carboxypeptidase
MRRPRLWSIGALAVGLHVDFSRCIVPLSATHKEVNMRRNLLCRAGVLLAVLVLAGSATAAVEIDTSALREAVTVDNVRTHQAAFQSHADAMDADGTRVAGTAGHDMSAQYVADLLLGAGYQVNMQAFEFPFFQELSPAILEQVAPSAVAYTNGVDHTITQYSAAGDVTAAVVATTDLVLPPTPAPSSTSGCEATDFPASTAGAIALIQRGTCTFQQKVLNAEAAGAVGVIIFNEGQVGRTNLDSVTLGVPVGVPVVFVTFALGNELNSLISSGLRVRLATDTVSEIRTTHNVIAETPGGRDDRVVVVGAHLDSVAEGPGINDNGSGSAVILEIALQMAALGIEPRNKVRFAWWSAEEEGLIGSAYYVSQLSARDIKNIALNLNFDMVGSPNFVRFVYDGDGSGTGTAGPNGSKVIEQVFLDYFAGQGLPSEPTPFDGRSDYGPFIDVGIPAGGLFTGAEGIKTAEQVEMYGGTSGEQYDPCYHQACDTVDNVDVDELDRMADATAHAVLTFAMTTSAVNGTDKGKGKGQFQNVLEFRGPRAQR